MALKYPKLFTPISIRGHVFKNRILAAPLGAWTFSPDNYIFDYAISNFEAKAKGGAAAVCVGHTEIHYLDDDSDGFGLYFDLRKREGTAALTTFAQAIQQYGAHAGVELNYGGMAGDLPRQPGQKYAYDINGGENRIDEGILPLTKEKMREIIDNYVKCVEKLRLCGFHMVTIHGAHGWMPAMFLSSRVNHRTDEYGGCLENRMRFPLEIMQAVRQAAGPKMIVEYRISGLDPEKDPEGFEEEAEFVARLRGLADIIHISAGGGDAGMSATFPSYLAPRGVNRRLAKAIKARTDIPVAVVGSISDPDMAEEILENGEADFVAMCRQLTADPEWPNKARQGRADMIRPCLACYNCLDQMHKTHFLGCDINPICGMEHRVSEVKPAAVKKNVVVVGGGPAGMVAAIVSAERGHQVTLLEKSDALGGLLKLSDGNGTKWMLNRYKEYLVRRVNSLPIDVRLNTAADAETVTALNADAVLVAGGSAPNVPAIPGTELPNVFTCVTAHGSADALGEDVIIVGGNLVGCEEALELKRIGKKNITVVEMTNQFHADAGMVTWALDEKLHEADIQMVNNARCTAILPDGILIEKDGTEQKLTGDSVLLAIGMHPCFDVYTELLDAAPTVEAIGDCLSASNIRNATRTAFYVANNI